MRRIQASCSLVLIIAAAPLAFAEDGDHYGDRMVGGAVKGSSVATVSLVGFAGGQFRALNSEGDSPVPVSSFETPQFYSIGKNTTANPTQEDILEAAWYEVVNPQGHFVHMIIRSREGKQFVPLGTTIDGFTVQAFSYELGGDGNGIDWRDWVTHVGVKELVTFYSTDGGTSVYSDPTIHDPFGGGHWNGIDVMHWGLEVPGSGVNWLQVSYKIDVVPAPGTLAGLTLAGGILSRRRRR
ncbi:MAG: PEP-CTERM sorting domain-containing protein [Phycisphaeraceae bacterium]|nr:PEP-CTERM sorting domain-containing protein [Phycisphaeraceae bacterium]